MNQMTPAQLHHLINRKPNPCVSLYMPTHRSGRERYRDPTRLKSLVADASQELKRMEMDSVQVGAITRDAAALVNQADFWLRSTNGLAIFADAEAIRVYQLPICFHQRIVVSHRFDTLPLLEYFQGDGRYFLLAASSYHVRLMEGSRYSLAGLDDAELPDSLVDALNSVAASDKRFDRFSGGQSSGSGVDKECELLSHLRRLDDCLRPYLEPKNAPLVLAGEEALIPFLRRTCSYRRLVDRVIFGNVDEMSAEQLHELVWKVIESEFAAARVDFAKEYEPYASRDLGSDDLAQIAEAALMGRVKRLMLLTHRNIPNHEPRLEHSAAQTLLSGGDVLLVEQQEQMPTESPVAATFRYPM